MKIFGEKEAIRAMVSLFKIIPASILDNKDNEETKSVIDCIKNGIVVIKGEEIVEAIPESYYGCIIGEIGYSLIPFNNTFHKSFSTVAQISVYEHYLEQVRHYFSVYGRNFTGKNPVVYIPNEALDVPKEYFASSDKITVIRAVFDDVISDKVNAYLQTTQKVHPRVKDAFPYLFKYATIPTESIKSYELRIMKYLEDGTMPEDPVSALRYLVYRTTDETLLIKNRELIRKIQYDSKSQLTASILKNYDLKKWASIFLRYKPIFLAYKKHEGCAPIINKIRRLAKNYHKPLSEYSLKNITSLVAKGDIDSAKKIIDRIDNNRDFVKIINALKNHLGGAAEKSYEVYNIRNGKAYVKKIDNATSRPLMKEADILMYLAGCLRKRLAPLLKDRYVIMPSYIDYAVPTSEKQFTGVFPWGTIVTPTADNVVAGIHWFNVIDEDNVDIDLHLNSPSSHYGWDGGFRNGQDVLFTGDMTYAPKPRGAAEAYWLNPNKDDYILSAHLYHSYEDGVEFKFFMTAQPRNAISRTYTYNPKENMFPPFAFSFEKDVKVITLGLFHDGKFYFCGGRINNNLVPKGDYEGFIKGTIQQLESKFTMRGLFELCGAKVISESEKELLSKEEREKAIDLSPNSLTATSLTEIIDGEI